MQVKNLQKNKGFTLVEIMVATFIFMIIMLAAIGALVSVSNAAKKAKALRSAMDNVNYAMDNMSRSLRLGSSYYCSSGSIFLPQTATQDCVGNSIAFIPSLGSAIDTSFELDSNEIRKCTPGGCASLTAPEVEITQLLFTVTGSDPVDGVHPSVFMLVKGNVKVNGEVTEFALQNFVSQRNAE